ncbi:MAG: hypothetical protein ACE5FU_15140, partial [Nitrospinota bacterium]
GMRFKISGRSDLFLSGERFLHRRNYQAALRCFEADLTTTPQIKTSDYRIDLLIHIGNIHAELGSQDRAQSYFQEVLSLQQNTNDFRAIGLTLVNLGNLSREAGRRTRAKAYYLEAQDHLKQSGDICSLAILYSNFGLLAQDEGDVDQGIAYLKKSIELHKQTGFEEGLARTWGNSAISSQKMGTTKMLKHALTMRRPISAVWVIPSEKPKPCADWFRFMRAEMISNWRCIASFGSWWFISGLVCNALNQIKTGSKNSRVKGQLDMIQCEQSIAK